MLYPRNIKNVLLEGSKDTPVLLLTGARQTGKSTLMTGLFPSTKAPAYLSFDDLLTLAAAKADPKGFVENLPEQVIIDEIQRAPELMLPIKHSVDRNRKPGRFFLTGSANVLALPKVADTLVGRIEIHTLWPLSQGEIRGVEESFVDAIFGKQELKAGKKVTQADIAELICTGGFPDVVQRELHTRRKHWFTSYISTLVERDVRDLRNIEQLVVMPRLLKLLASRTGNLLNYSDIARTLELKLTTLKTYMYLLQLLFLLVPVEPWFGNKGKRLVKAPKLHLADSGLLCHLLDLDKEGLAKDSITLGAAFENFVVMELVKQLSWSETQAKLYHLRTDQMDEVDIVLEAGDGRIVGIECKSTQSPSSDSFKGLKVLKELTGKKFQQGIVLYLGDQVANFGKDMLAVPVSALWETTRGSARQLD